MTAQIRMPIEPEEVQCDAACYNTNIFAPGGHKVRCDACRGRRGHYENDQWVECRNCAGTGSNRCPSTRYSK
jgi:hypothetical protein